MAWACVLSHRLPAYCAQSCLASLSCGLMDSGGKDGGAAWTHDDGGERGVIRESVTVHEWPREAVGAMDGLGRKGGRGIACDQPVITQHTQVVEQVVLLDPLEDFLKHGLEVARRDRIKQRADLIVTGNLLDAQPCLGVIVPWGVLQSALGLYK